jgi:hypothetical protein
VHGLLADERDAIIALFDQWARRIVRIASSRTAARMRQPSIPTRTC